jgi:dTDP-4-amino-4,6-dideoxy-D-galactose acyltransferase
MTPVQSAAPCEFLSWDSNFFDLRIARVPGDTLDREKAHQIDEWSQAEHITTLYFLARADCPATIRTAEENGFQLVDVRVTLEHKGKARPIDSNPSTRTDVRFARTEDIPVLQGIARSSHTDTRFFCDLNFPRGKVRDLYATWIELECSGRAQAVLVATSPAGTPLGYITCHFEPEIGRGQIGLVSVSEASRGKGLGKVMVLAALDWFEMQGAKETTVVTQGRNVAAQRLYQRCGFITRTVQLWFHKWYPACALVYA